MVVRMLELVLGHVVADNRLGQRTCVGRLVSVERFVGVSSHNPSTRPQGEAPRIRGQVFDLVGS